MIIGPGFVYLHMPRTGGTWTREVLKTKLGAVHHAGWHDPISRLESEYLEGRMVWGTIRNPWDWYLSIYQYAMAHPEEIKKLRVYGKGSMDFRDVVHGMTHPVMGYVPDWPGVIWRIFPERDREDVQRDLAESGLGLWSWVVTKMYGPRATRLDALVDTGRLYDGLSELLGVDCKEFRPKNTKEARPVSALEDPRGLYDEESLGWVTVADGHLATTLGYGKPFESHPEAVIRP